MKMMKLALLGGAALAVSAIGAQADDLDALKAEIEALNARVAQLEATPSVPAGYQLVTIREGDAMTVPGLNTRDPGYGTKATVISIMPTADAPSSTSIEWSGYARAILTYNSIDEDADINVRGQLKVVGKTDTAVGEVGAIIQLRSEGFLHDTKAFTKANEVWGWWAMTPEITLGGGYSGSLGNIAYGLDGACNCYGTDNFETLNPGDAEQMRLTWTSGPISIAGAIEDSDYTLYIPPGVIDGDGNLAYAAEVKYSGDTINGEVSAFFDPNFSNDVWQAGAGVGFALGDMASISLGADIGQRQLGTVGGLVGDDFWEVTALVSANLSDAIHGEVAYQYSDYSEVDNVNTAIAGIYYDPVSQLTIGVEAEWKDNPGEDYMGADLVTVFRF
jgi:hypothetical protein